MPDQTGDPGYAKKDSSSDAFWDTYLSQASEEDKFLPNSWEANTGGILTFTGLFAATVAAFLIESYKSLSPDTGDQTVYLLYQLLATTTNASAHIPSSMIVSEPFQVTPTAIAVNSLWFSSLLISLACALLSTLIQEWAREYRRNINRRRTLDESTRTRAFNHIYVRMGIDRYGMDRAVDLVTALVHLSVILFTVGLVIFLFPIDGTVASVALSVFGVFFVVYVMASLLPLLDSSCPYRTPVTHICAKFLWLVLRELSSTVLNSSISTLMSAPALQETSTRSIARHHRFLTSSRFAFAWDRTSRYMTNSSEQFQRLLGSLSFTIPESSRDEAEYAGHIWSDRLFFEDLDKHLHSLLSSRAFLTPAVSQSLVLIFRLMFAFDDEHPNGHARDSRSVRQFLNALSSVGRLTRNSDNAAEKLAARLCLADLRNTFIRIGESAHERGIRVARTDRFLLDRPHVFGADLLHPAVQEQWMNISLVPLHDDDCCDARRDPPSPNSRLHEGVSNALTAITDLLEADHASRDMIGVPEWLTSFCNSLRPEPPFRQYMPSKSFVRVLQAAGLERWLEAEGGITVHGPNSESPHYEYLSGRGKPLIWCLYKLSQCADMKRYAQSSVVTVSSPVRKPLLLSAKTRQPREDHTTGDPLAIAPHLPLDPR